MFNVVDVKVSADSIAYLQQLLASGLLQGPVGDRAVNPTVRLLFDAVYHVLSGGSVKGNVPGTLTIAAGHAANVAALQQTEQLSIKAINSINAGHPHNIVMEG